MPSQRVFSSSFLPVVLFPSQVPWLPFHSRAHDAVSPPWDASRSLNPQAPSFPTPHTRSGCSKPSPAPEVLLQSAEEGYFSALLCHSIWPQVAALSCALLYVDRNFSQCFCCFGRLKLYQTHLQWPIDVILLCIVHRSKRLRGLGLLFNIYFSYLLSIT